MTHALLSFLFTLSLLTQQPAELSVQFNQAVALQQEGKFAEAAEQYRAILQRKPDYAEAQANLAAVLGRLGKYKEAVTAYETALKLAPQFVPIWLNLGILHYRANEFEGAINALDKFLEAHPNHLQARQLLGLSLIEIGYNTAGIEQLQPTLAMAATDIAVLYSIGLAQIRTNQLNQAEEMVEKLAAVPAGKATSHLLKGQLQLARFEFEKAIASLKQSEELNPDLPRLHYSLGLCYYKLGRSKEGLAAFAAESKRRPKDFLTLYYLALLYESEGDAEAAKPYADAALTLQPNSMEALTVLSKVLSRQNKNEEAASALEKAVAQDPKDAQKHYLLGKIYRELGRREDSNRAFNEARRLKAEEAKADQEKPIRP